MKFRGIIAAAAAGVLLASTAAGAQETAPRRGWLGITYTADDRGGTEEVQIESVYPGSPAAAAGVRAGDLILRWNGSEEVAEQLERLRLQPGDTVRLRIRREEERDRDFLVVVGDRPTTVNARAEQEFGPFGMSQEEMEALQKELRRTQEEVVRLWEGNDRGVSAEERARLLQELAQKQQQLAQAFQESWRVRGALADSLARFWRDGLVSDSLALHADSLQRQLRLHLRTELGPQLRNLREQLATLGSEGTSRAVIALGHRGVAGAEFEEMNQGLSDYFGTDHGLLVLRVSEGTPAGRAGLEPGDVVLEADGRDVGDVEDLRAAVARAEHGREKGVTLEILRRGEREEVQLRWE